MNSASSGFGEGDILFLLAPFCGQPFGERQPRQSPIGDLRRHLLLRECVTLVAEQGNDNLSGAT